MKIDLHCHTEASADCITPLSLFPAQCRAREIQVQAITDHDQVWGAQKLQEMVQAQQGDTKPPLAIIVGEEIMTNEGEIIGLFLKEKIEPGLSPEETVAQIRAQNGLVLLPHGFDPLKRYRLQPDARARIAHEFDIIEGFNARVSRPRWNAAAVAWAVERDLPVSAGTDAHTLADVGTAWIDVPEQPIDSPQALLAALKDAEPTGKWVHPVLAFLLKQWDRLRQRLRG